MLFLRAEVKVPISGLSGAITTLAGKAAQGDDRRIRKRARLLQQPIRQLRLRRHAGLRIAQTLALHLISIKAAQRLEQLHLALLLFDAEALQQAANVGDRHITAATTTLDVILLSLAKDSDPLTLGKRKQSGTVLQQYHALSGRLTGNVDMFLASGHAAAISPHGRTGHITDSLPFC